MGSEGHIEIEMPFSTAPGQPANIWLLNANGRQLLLSDVADQYIMQADAFANAILTQSDVPTSFTDAVSNMKVIEAIFKSGSLKQWVYIV